MSQHSDAECIPEYATFETDAGHRLAFSNCGDPTGLAVVFLHGSPGSRLEGLAHCDLGRALGLWIITVERPGMGHSDFAPNQTLIQVAQDILALLDHLKIARFAAIGYSGGAGSLHALRYIAPDRVLAAADIAGFVPIRDQPSLHPHLATLDRLFSAAGRRFPAMFRLSFWMLQKAVRAENPQWLARFMRSSLSPTDQDWLAKEDTLPHLQADMRLAFRKGTAGPVQDALQLYGSWGFDLPDGPRPLLIFAGGDDRFVPTEFAHWKASFLPSSRLTIFEDVGHFGIMQYMPEILKALALEARKPVGPSGEGAQS